jgi:DNA-binding transcriptional MerR regulator
MDAPDLAASRRPAKSEAAFRTISEVSEDLDVPQHVLRFWESKFAQIKPLKRGGGRRYYRPEDVVLLCHIRDLLYRDGYTIRGVQKLLREPGARSRIDAGEPEAHQPQPQEAAADQPEEASAGQGEVLRDVLGELLELRRLLADARRK